MMRALAALIGMATVFTVLQNWGTNPALVLFAFLAWIVVTDHLIDRRRS